MPWYGSHTYLNEFIQTNNSRHLMEIGVYNGQNALSMVKAAMGNQSSIDITYYGFDFFNYYDISKIKTLLEETGCNVKLFKGNSLDTLPKVIKNLPKMDIIFIDGGKSFTVSMSDWENSSNLMHQNTGVFIHNVGFSGVGRMVNTISRIKYNVKLFYPEREGRVALIRKKTE